MKSTIYPKRPPRRILQKCPLCGGKHPIILNGLVRGIETDSFSTCPDRGYSFCNCRNIFFTDWKNVDSKEYNERYRNKFSKKITENETKKIFAIAKKINSECKSFLDIVGLDKNLKKIAKEHYSLDKVPKYDFIYASYYLQRVRSVDAELKRIHSLLNDGGIAYIAMPNTRFIDFDHGNAIDFDWFVSENHTLWNLDDFLEVALENKFTCEYSENGLDYYKVETGEWFWRKDFKTILRRIDD